MILPIPIFFGSSNGKEDRDKLIKSESSNSYLRRQIDRKDRLMLRTYQSMIGSSVTIITKQEIQHKGILHDVVKTSDGIEAYIKHKGFALIEHIELNKEQ